MPDKYYDYKRKLLKQQYEAKLDEMRRHYPGYTEEELDEAEGRGSNEDYSWVYW